MTLEECIKEIVGKIRDNFCFDSHMVIEELIKNKDYHEAYLKEYAATTPTGDIKSYHSKIANIIKGLPNVKPVVYEGKELQSYSLTIYDQLSENELWQKNKLCK